jgi:serine/threonine protein phosphatase PrpC
LILQDDDQLLLCSDGLWGGFPDETILANLLGQDSDMSSTGMQLVQSAMGAGSNDHISFVWAKIVVNGSNRDIACLFLLFELG